MLLRAFLVPSQCWSSERKTEDISAEELLWTSWSSPESPKAFEDQCANKGIFRLDPGDLCLEPALPIGTLTSS